MGKIKLNVLGISYSQTQSGAYALVLSEENGTRRIPIIIGGFEAQAIAIQLEDLVPPRPLTHDLFLNFARTFGIELLEVNIYKLEEGVFYSNLLCFDGDKELTIDARTSDAIALALRFKCPIFTTDAIIEKAGIVLDPEEEASTKMSQPVPTHNPDDEESEMYRNLTLPELEALLKEAINNEDYEKASKVQEEINKRS
ncbi:MAG TPA: bifunctional nuclease family protein [Williamwhitmania sp.]|nr:bifunctional nuclease family protein [Williamwhitmania sp.]